MGAKASAGNRQKQVKSPVQKKNRVATGIVVESPW